jgi:pilus assembly protein Flp/PilA
VKMKALAKKFINDERGLETVEYAIIAGLIVVGTITTIIAIGTWVQGKFDALNSALGSN